jgi:FkbM family methyltransferase
MTTTVLEKSGLIAPAFGRGDKFFEPVGGPHDLPLHNRDQAVACVQACSERLRVAIDGGAYCGTWGMQLLPNFEKIFLFEPVEENFNCCRLNMVWARDKMPKAASATTRRLALSSSVGTRPMFSPGTYKNGVRARKAYAWKVGEGNPEDTITVPSTTIDNLNLEVLDLLKLDVEGHEYEVLQGARVTILKCRPVIMIEEKLDSEYRATAFLEHLGMVYKKSIEQDRLFVWPKQRGLR